MNSPEKLFDLFLKFIHTYTMRTFRVIAESLNSTRKILRTTLIFLVAIVACIGGVAFGIIYGYVKSAPILNEDDIQIKILTSYIHDREGNITAELKGSENQNRILVLSKDIPKNLKNAFIAVEDARFEQHKGVDLIGVFNAGLSVFSSRSRGGSTITQQVVKNLTQETRRDLKRKVQEIARALDLEKRKSKEEIIELYCNLIYFGNSCYGVESASRLYFNKSCKDLTLAECASLAAIPNLPSVYAPFNLETLKLKTDKNRERQLLILKDMLEQNRISKSEYDQAVNEKLQFADPKAKKEEYNISSIRSYYEDEVIREVKKDLMSKGYSEQFALNIIYNYGVHIYTNLDPKIQQHIDNAFNDERNFPNPNPSEHPQAATVVLESDTGRIVAMYGGFGKKKRSATFNMATQSMRSPGSTIKSIAAYAPAIDSGQYTAASVIDDAPSYLNPDRPNMLWPTNYNKDTYMGLTTLREALVQSNNVVAAKLYKNIGAELGLSYMKKAGINRENEKQLPLVLGGLTKGLNPYLMAGAYLPFANKGEYIEPSTYTCVKDRNGRDILIKNPKRERVYSEQTAYIMTSIMKDVCTRGTAVYINPDGSIKPYTVDTNNGSMPVAGKTGTTSDARDKWFVGYTPYYVCAVWYGYEHNLELQKNEYDNAKNLWKVIMDGVHRDLPIKDFDVPPGLVVKQVCRFSGKLATTTCAMHTGANAVIEEIFAENNQPTEPCDAHVEAWVCRSGRDQFGRRVIASPGCIPERAIVVRNNEPMFPSPYIVRDAAFRLSDQSCNGNHGFFGQFFR